MIRAGCDMFKRVTGANGMGFTLAKAPAAPLHRRRDNTTIGQQQVIHTLLCGN
jgi:hypothetical protein